MIFEQDVVPYQVHRVESLMGNLWMLAGTPDITMHVTMKPCAVAGTVTMCADLKLLILRQHTGGVAAGMSGEAVIKLAQTKMSTELRGLLQARAVSDSCYISAAQLGLHIFGTYSSSC